MKKGIALFLALALCASLTACGKKEEKSSGSFGSAQPAAAETQAQPEASPEQPEVSPEQLPAAAQGKEDLAVEDVAGAYVFEGEEEIEGNTVEFQYWLVLKDDMTGWLSGQDLIPVVWDLGGVLPDFEGAEPYTYTLEGDILTLQQGDFTTEYVRTDEDVPDFDEIYASWASGNASPTAYGLPEALYGTFTVQSYESEGTELDPAELGMVISLDFYEGDNGYCADWHRQDEDGYTEELTGLTVSAMPESADVVQLSGSGMRGYQGNLYALDLLTDGEPYETGEEDPTRTQVTVQAEDEDHLLVTIFSYGGGDSWDTATWGDYTRMQFVRSQG